MLKQEKINLIAVIISIVIACIVMFVFINQKQGWHEDEVFSYGSSNYKYDNVFQRCDYKDSLNKLIDEKIIDNNFVKTIKNIGYYATHSNEFMLELNEKIDNEKPIWKTPNQAKEYLSVSEDEIFNYWSVYYNQSRDVHPPLFYILVHLVSSICINNFSKYIIFFINIVFFMAICIMIRNIMKLLGKDKLSAISILLYGLSMGAISTVMFQRMYTMLTFFTITYLYLILKIIKCNFVIDKNIKKQLFVTILLGFLTQYYFCIYVVLIAIIMITIMIKQKQYNSAKNYLVIHLKSAIIGVLLFPASIYHIFFSYRGIGGDVIEVNYLSRMLEFIDSLLYSFSIPTFLGYIVLILLMIFCFLKLSTAKSKDIVSIMIIPIILFFFIIVKIAPITNIRYIFMTFPIITILLILTISNIIKYLIKQYTENTEYSSNIEFFIILILTIGISIYGFNVSKPQFLYSEYSKRIEIAENYRDLKLVYIGEGNFNHLQDIEEFLRYKSSLIINTSELEVLKENEGLKDENEFILNIKSWSSNPDESLEKTLKYSNATDYQLLLDDGLSRIYKIMK